MQLFNNNIWKLLEIEAWFYRNTNRKWHMGYQMVTWPTYKLYLITEQPILYAYRSLLHSNRIINSCKRQRNFCFSSITTSGWAAFCDSSTAEEQSMWAERERSVSGAENGAERAENGMSGSGAVSWCWKKIIWVGAERSGLNRPLKIRSHQHCVDLAISAVCILLFY